MWAIIRIKSKAIKLSPLSPPFIFLFFTQETFTIHIFNILHAKDGYMKIRFIN